MGGRNMARPTLRRSQLMNLEPGRAVVNGDMEIFVKRADGLWEGEHGRRVTDTLLEHGPVKLWPYPVSVKGLLS